MKIKFMYKVPLIRISRILNPFKDPGNFGIDFDFVKNKDWYKEEIDSYFKDSKIQNNTIYQIKKNIIENFSKDIILDFNLTQEDYKSPYKYLLSDPKLLCAAIFLEKKYIYANIQGPEHLIKAFLGYHYEKYIVDDITFESKEIKNGSSKISWDVSSQLLEKTWGNEDFILKNLENVSTSSLDSIFKKISPHLFEDFRFILKLLHTNNIFLDFIEPKYLINPDLINSIESKDSNILLRLWKNYLVYIKNPDEKYKFTLEKNIKALSDISENKKNKAFEALEAKLTDKEICKSVLGMPYEGVNNPKFYINYYFSDEVKKDLEIQDYTLHQWSKIGLKNIKSFLPADFFEKFQNLIMYLQEVGNSKDTENFENEIKKIFEMNNCANNKKEILKLTNHFMSMKYNPIHNAIYSNISEKLKQDLDFIKKLTSLVYIDFDLLEDNIKQDSSIIDTYISYIDLDKYKVSKDLLRIIQNESDREKLKKYLSKFDVSIILDNHNTSRHLKDDPEIVMMARSGSRNMSNYYFSEVLIKKIIENGSIAQFIENFPSFYLKLPKHLQFNPEYALLNYKVNSQSVIGIFPKIDVLFLESKEFVSEALIYTASEHYSKFVPKIPSQFWYDKNFVLTLAQNVDSGKIKNNIWKFAPHDVQLFLESCNINENYTQHIRKMVLEENLKEISENKEIKRKKI